MVAVRGGCAGVASPNKPSPISVFGVSSVGGVSSQTPHCPNCSSLKVWRDGLRKLTNGECLQRWLCRDCGLRFSEKSLNTETDYQVMPNMRLEKAKNLGFTAETKTVVGGIKRKPPSVAVRNIDLISGEARGLLTEFMAYLEREGFAKDISYPHTLAHLAKDGADLLNPESVKQVIASQRKANGESWSNSMKLLATCAYDAFVKMKGLCWVRPVYHQDDADVPLIDEKDLDLLIGASKRKLATFLLCLKETYADPSEILRCEWIDLKDNILCINRPVKGHLPGKYELSARLVAMLNALPHKRKRVFATSYDTIYGSLVNTRKKAAGRFQNPALLQICFKSFRHWGGTKVAYESHGNIIVIMQALRHKSFKSSLRYIHAVHFKENDFDTAVATSPEEILSLGKSGWLKFDELTVNGVQMHFYRKPKQFGGDKTQVDKSEKRDDKFLCTV